MHYFETGMELSVAKYVCRYPLALGKPMEARRWTAGYGGTLIRRWVVGDLLWVVVIAFLFSVITGVLG